MKIIIGDTVIWQNKNVLFLLNLVLFVIAGCFNSEKTDYKTIAKEDVLVQYTALPKTVKSPKDNPSSPEKAALGKLLFFDPILSGNKDVACATCHHPKNGYAEFRDISIGVNGKGFGSTRVFNTPNDIPFVKRNAHTILNTAYNGIDTNNEYDPEKAPMFWDSRVESLEKQALEPIKALEEMRGRKYAEKDILDVVIARLKAIPEYQTLFEEAFGEKDAINSINLSKAIAVFERTLVTNNSRFDQYVAGDENAISLSEKEGFKLFKKVGCANCHKGPMFSDYKMHVLSLQENNKLKIIDSGFGQQFSFRTPSLRNLQFTAPYMHNGKMKNLQKVLEFYEDIASGRSQNPNIEDDQLDSLVKKIRIKVMDMAPIISFLNTLNETDFDKEVVDAVPSGLPVGGDIN
ncbi:cytochrome-c peroxidase [Aquimarina algiphila]|uniref:Cytochrome-c peroxidase n=1 Tax=Aquimarina algiphila TaxID=2047982 RepID=A0A554VNG6_9FLAO|nr:cytochrome-c peroxidase [Aquimarina algiphila]TSE09918.1 cytochrome-c peroxidase [Aquimarina algiphila]